MANIENHKTAERELLATARAGRLPEYLKNAPEAGASAMYDLVWNLVYERLTREVERGRGHQRCAVSVQYLEPNCHDAHQDAVTAVLEDLQRNAHQPIENLHGWLVSRMRPVTIDAHRRMRGARGAQQRPRLPLPRWLADELKRDLWLEVLAVEILTWVGIPTAVPGGLWPLSAWADRRSAVTSEPGYTDAQVAGDVERVLAAMRTNHTWYEKYIERPLGTKQAPLSALPYGDSGQLRETALPLVAQHEIDDAHLTELASEAVAAIGARVRRGDDLRSAVVHVVSVVFGSGTGVVDMDRIPNAGVSAEDQAASLLADPATIDRIVAAAMEIIGGH